MTYQAVMTEKGLMLAWRGHAVLEGLQLHVNLTRHQSFTSMPVSVNTERGKTEILFDTCRKMERLALVLREEADVLQIALEATVCNFYDLYANETFMPEDSVVLRMTAAGQPKGMLANSMVSPWWQTPAFPAGFEALPRVTQNVLMQAACGAHLHLQPLVGNKFRTDFYSDGLSVTLGVGGLKEIKGAVLSLSASNDPYVALEQTYVCQKKLGGIRVPLREERTYLDMFEHFGWCTWNACYHDVTSQKIYDKLDELKQKNIKIGWVLIDDGWFQYTSQQKLTSMKEDLTKFPEGLKETVRRIKEEYGVKYVGVWHAFTGYWEGIEPGSEVHREQKDNLMQTAAGWIIPSPRGERAFKFWDAWHSYLAAQGIDFVKVDNQSSFSTKLDGEMPTAEGVRRMHEALERSVNKNFGGAIINCMGMNTENILNRPTSALNRNSDDFFPKKENGFKAHIYQNAYNALAHGHMQYCDFDMWWSEHESALESSVLRAISGGPIYVSDETGKTDGTYIAPLIDENSRIFRPDFPARPTYDCLYTDCAAAEKPLKLFNFSGDNMAVAAFGLSDNQAQGTLRLADVPGAGTRYVAVNYFTGEEIIVDEKTVLPIALDKGQVALWNFYAVKEGKALIGSRDRYMGCVGAPQREMIVED